MALRGKKPEQVDTGRAKIMLSGPSGSGKTWFSIDFPSVYYMDVEGGARQPHYREKLKVAKAGYFGPDDGACSMREVIAEIKALATEPHPYKTLVIDSFTKLYNIEIAEAETKHGSAFGTDKKEANKPVRQMINWLHRLDMNVVIVCHAKEKWGGEGKDRQIIGTTFDGYDKLEYELDLWMETKVNPKTKERTLEVKKSRIEGLPVFSTIPTSFSEFAAKFNGDLGHAVKQVELATADQVAQIQAVLSKVKLDPPDRVEKYLTKCKAESLEELNSKQAADLLEGLKKLLV
jgi:hypothetical protein